MKVLVVVDMQNDFINGALGSKEAQSIVPNVVKKIKDFKGQIVVTKDTHYQNYLETQEGKNLPVPHCLIHTEGWELHPDVWNSLYYPLKCPIIINKPTFGSVELPTIWKDCNDNEDMEFTLVGLCTDICVISNAMIIKSFYPEAKVSVDASCCAGVTPESHKNALEAMKMCQINVIDE